MIKIIGYTKIKSKKNEQYYVVCHYSYPDRIDYGMAVAQAVVKDEVFEKWNQENLWDHVSDGYDRVRKSHFLFLK